MSFGRGGAGNKMKPEKIPPVPSQTTPTLKSKNYSTGRGGTGNIAKNDPERPEIARERQDVDIPAIKLTDESYHVGRGGAANAFKPSEEEIKAAKDHGERDKVRSSSVSSVEGTGKAEKKSVKGLAKKGKEILLPNDG